MFQDLPHNKKSLDFNSFNLSQNDDNIIEKSEKKVFYEVGCALLTKTDIFDHIKKIQNEMDWYRPYLFQILRKLFEHPKNKGIFNSPVDPVKLGIPSYFSIIKEPMDLRTIKMHLEDDEIDGPNDFEKLIRLMFNNAIKFHSKCNKMIDLSRSLLEIFCEEWTTFQQQNFRSMQELKNHSCEHCLGVACSLCQKKCLLFNESSIYCTSPCKTRIKKNSVYYRLGGEQGQHWCNKCYSNLSDSFANIFGKIIKKSTLERCVNNNVRLEAWVKCTLCKGKLHEICTLYHPLCISKPKAFICILCIAKKIKDQDEKSISTIYNNLNSSSFFNLSRVSFANIIPQCNMSRYLENELWTTTKEKLLKRLKNPEMAEEILSSLTVRVLSNTICQTKYEPRINCWLEYQNIHDKQSMESSSASNHFSCRTKTIALFKRIHGIDVIVFILFAQEYDNNCPMPNNRKVYISYLDSLVYMAYSKVRTIIFQSIIVSYFKWVKARGFHHVYLWICPPKRGENYILYCHPKWQRTPGSDRLRKWYKQIIEICKKSNIVISQTNFFKKYLFTHTPTLNTRFSKRQIINQCNNLMEKSPLLSSIIHNPDDENSGQLSHDFEPTEREDTFKTLPYFLGDFLPNETEKILKELYESTKNKQPNNDPIAKWWRTIWDTYTKTLNSNNTDTQTITLKSYTQTAESYITIYSCDPMEELLKRRMRSKWLTQELARSFMSIAKNFIVLNLSKEESEPIALDSYSVKNSITTLDGQYLIPDTSDPDQPIEKDIFCQRVDFLNFCKKHNLQFDELRRAKLSSLVLLHYLASSRQ